MIIATKNDQLKQNTETKEKLGKTFPQKEIIQHKGDTG